LIGSDRSRADRRVGDTKRSPFTIWFGEVELQGAVRTSVTADVGSKLSDLPGIERSKPDRFAHGER